MEPIETKLATTAIGATAGPAKSAIERWGVQKYDQFLVKFTDAFSENLTKSRDKCKTVRNVLYRNQLAQTDQKYVSISFLDQESDEVTDFDVLRGLQKGEHIVLRGRGGAGKTMLTKWSVLRLIDTILNHQRIPIYVELRDLPADAEGPFENYLYNYFSTNRSKRTLAQFIEGLKQGLFAFVLDAADEIKKDIRPELCRKIEEFRSTYPECSILLTSRDFTEIENIHGFRIIRTRALGRQEAISVLEKLDYDEDVRDALIEYIQSEDTSQHTYFLENPLLVTIMLLTFDQSKDIPKKRSAFYKRAYEALYERHDGSKGIYRRDHHAGLPLDEFERLFSIFCYGTYINGKIDLDEMQLISLMRESAKISGLDVEATDVAKDAYESVCLLVKEGHDYTFCHRSFQEYFVAVFLRDYRGGEAQQIYARALEASQGENVLEFINEMDQTTLEREFVIPKLRSLIKRISRKMKDNQDSLAIFKHFYNHLRVSNSKLSFAGWDPNNLQDGNFLSSLSTLFDTQNHVSLVINLKSMETNDTLTTYKFPLEVALKTRSSRRVYSQSWNKEVIEIRPSPSAESWFRDSEFHTRILDLWEKLTTLLAELESKHSGKPEDTFQEFRKFESSS